MIPVVASPMKSENASIIIESPSIIPAAEDEGLQVIIPIYQDETVENDTPDGNRDGDEFLGGLFVGLESNEGILGRSFLQFDLISYPANLGYQSAYLYVHLNAEYLSWDDQDAPIGVYYCANDSWTDDTITWNNQPTFSGSPTDVIDSPASPDMFDPGGWYVWDVTSDVNTAFAGDRILTEVLKITDEDTPSSCWKYFTEYEHSAVNSSYIALEYNEPVVDNLAVNGYTEQPYTDYIQPPGILSWDILGDGSDEGQSNYDLKIYTEPGATGSLVYSDTNLYSYTIFGGASSHPRPFGESSEMRFQFKYGDDLLQQSGVVDTVSFDLDYISTSMEFENLSIFMVAVDNADALTSDFQANYEGRIPTPVFYRERYTAPTDTGWIMFDIDNSFYISERSSLIVEFRWAAKDAPNIDSEYGTGLSGSVAYSYGAGAILDTTADWTLDRTHSIQLKFISDVVTEDGSGTNGYPFGAPTQGVFQYKYNKSLISEIGTIDKLYFGVEDFGNNTMFEDVRIWMAETPVEGALSKTLADNYGGTAPILVMAEDLYEARNLGHALEFDIANVFNYTGEYDLLIELRFSNRIGVYTWSFREFSGGGYRAGHASDHTATIGTYNDSYTYDFEMSFARSAEVDLPDILNEGEYYYARIRPCDTTGIWGNWTEIGFKYDSVPEYVENKIRVAIYDEPTYTAPSWTSHSGGINNNVTGMYDILRSYGYEVSILTTTEIENHALVTANYDVFVMVDNFPQDSIVNYVREYWLGGGGILALDGSGQFLSYIGAIPVEAEGTDGYGSWTWETEDHNITTIHPVTRGYSLHETIDSDEGYNYLAWNATTLGESASAEDITILARSVGDSLWVTALALEPHNITKGGKVVTIGTDLAHLDEMPLYQMFDDAVEWLAPKPKARVAYDLSHHPYYGVDTWDSAYANYTGSANQEDLRNELVSRGYTFDKFYPSTLGNLTMDRLSQYDLLILSAPVFDFLPDELDALKTWVEDGGSLILNGEWIGFEKHSNVINALLSGLESDIEIHIGDEYGTSQIVEIYDHPTMEDVSEIMHSGGSYINVTGDAVALTHLGDDLCSAVENLDSGRIYVSGDINTFANFIDFSNNTQHAVNLFNWLTSSEATVLAYVDTSYIGVDPNWNIYRGPVAEALNTLGLEFYMTTNRTYFEMSLNQQTWDLVVVDCQDYGLSGDTYSELEEYLEAGGRLIISSLHTDSTHSLWDYLGVAGSEGILTPPEYYVWDSTHPIFESPIDFSASSFTSSFTHFPFTATAANLTLHTNATGLAGTTVGSGIINAGIAEGVDGRAIVNGMLLTLYEDDADLSGYGDGFEIWLNEIVYLLRPVINSPEDITFEIGDTGNEFTWTPTSPNPWQFRIEIDSVLNSSGLWFGSESFYFDVDDYPAGTHTFSLTVWDQDGGITTDEVIIIAAIDLTDPIIDSPLDIEYTEGATGNNITWTASDANQDNFIILINGTSPPGYPAVWNTTSIVLDVDDLAVGVYNFTIVVFDAHGHSATDIVFVTVLADTTTTTTTTTTDTTDTTDTNTTTPPPGDVDIIIIILIIAGAGGAIIIIIIIVIMKKRGG